MNINKIYSILGIIDNELNTENKCNDIKLYEFLTENKTNIIENKINSNYLYNILNNYINHNDTWFNEEMIIISFIDKLVEIDFIKYREYIIGLHDILINYLKFIYYDIQNNPNKYDKKYTLSLDYIYYLINCNDLTKLKPTIEINIFVYYIYNTSYYKIDLYYNNKRYTLYNIINIHILNNNNVFDILYANISNILKYNNNLNIESKKRTFDEMNKTSFDNSNKKNKY